MELSIFQADAFTDKLFGGNPAAIVPLQSWLSDTQMQQIAAENNLAETAFFVPSGDGFELRWFTPELEIDLCGHATLATAHILYTELGYKGNEITFKTVKAGNLIVTHANGVYTLDFPSRVPQPHSASNELLQAMGGPKPVAVLNSRDIMLVYEHEDEVAALNPDFAAIAKMDMMGIIATAPGNSVDFISRFFIPSAGINEDPVTGSAHCNLIPYWAAQLGKTTLTATQISARKGDLLCKLQGDRVLMAGKAVTYLRGTIFV